MYNTQNVKIENFEKLEKLYPKRKKKNKNKQITNLFLRNNTRRIISLKKN